MKEKNLKKHNIFFDIFLSIVFLCACYMIFTYAKSFFKNHINIYQVEDGSLKKEEKYRGFIYRDEEVITCDKSGYCSFIYANASRVSKDSIIMIFTERDYSD
ncbi:MAG: hypothetical protein MJ151_04510, partial [Lachnospiraceae bacterium]|nr:hypothetical protein [Lachnospiraceae bacterium]